MGLSNRESRLPYNLSVVAGALLASIILIPTESFAWSERYFSRGDGHGQYLARRDSIALGLGDAMHSNRAIHTIDPWPRHAKDDKLEFDGQRMDLSIELYQKNQSIEPQGTSTLSGGSGGSTQ